MLFCMQHDILLTCVETEQYSEVYWGGVTDRNGLIINLFFDAIWIYKEGCWDAKFAQGEISLSMILHAANTAAITNLQRRNYIFWKIWGKDQIITLG